MLISNKGKKFLTGRQISYLCCLWAWPGSNIFKNFFNKKFLDLSLEYSFNSAGHSENIDFFGPCLLYTNIMAIYISPMLLIER